MQTRYTTCWKTSRRFPRSLGGKQISYGRFLDHTDFFTRISNLKTEVAMKITAISITQSYMTKDACTVEATCQRY